MDSGVLCPRASSAIVGFSSPYRRATLLSLPAEIILLIVEFFPAVHRYNDSCSETTFRLCYFERQDTIRALSQTSKGLRGLLLPLAWECLEACYYRGEDRGHVAHLVWKQRRLSRGLSENPELAKHIRIAIVAIVSQSSAPSNLLSCLRSLQNLHTLRFPNYSKAASLTISSVLSPQARTVVIAAPGPRSHCPCFPFGHVFRKKGGLVVEGVMMAKPRELMQLYGTPTDLEEVDGFELGCFDVNHLVRAAPRLRKITFRSWIPAEDLECLRPLKTLRVISMFAFEYGKPPLYEPKPAAELDEWLTTAMSVLREHQVSGLGEKRVKMHYISKAPPAISHPGGKHLFQRIEDLRVDSQCRDL